jgi:hypothetical protein
MSAKRRKPKPDQHKLFMKTAKEMGSNESEGAFDKTLRKIGKAKPGPDQPT